jgi:DNA-binding GntR family transcriptional regulator
MVSSDRGNQTFKTSAEQAYEIICEKIINGELKPGEHLTRRNMAKLTGLSVIPVIEALHRLEGEGLVVSEPHFGTRVIEMDQRTIADRFALRMAIECEVFRILAQHHDEYQLERLASLAKQLDATPRTEEHQAEFWKLHHAFHLQMARYSGCESFVEALSRLNLFDILRRTILTYTRLQGHEAPKNHHGRLVEAIATGDKQIAEDAIREHMNFSGLVTEEQF